MAGVICNAGTEAIVGLSNPSYNSEGFRILFPGAAASGPSPNNPAFPSPGSLCGATFCSILSSGPGAGLSVGRGGESGWPALPPARGPAYPGRGRARGRVSSAAAARASRRAARKWRRPQPQPAGRPFQTPGRPRPRRQCRPPRLGETPLFLRGPSGADAVPSRCRMEADEGRKKKKSAFREPPPPSLKSSRGRSRGGGRTPRAGRGPKKGRVGGFYGVSTVRRARSRTDTKAISKWMDVDCNGGLPTTRRLGLAGLAGCRGRQNPPAPSRGCSNPARNGAAEPRASPLYIGGGAELRRSCAPPRSRLPPPLLRAHARSHARPERARGPGAGRRAAGALPIGSPEG